MSTVREKTVYFLRHGESEGNIFPVFQAPDSPLSEKGREQALYVAQRIAKLPFDALVASPMERAKQTAEFITHATGKNPLYNDLFMERLKPSGLNGKPYSDKEADALWKAWEESLALPSVKIEDGESFGEIVSRADQALTFLEHCEEGSIVVVTHGYFLRVIVARILLGDFLTSELFLRFHKATATKNTGITVLKYDKKQAEGDLSWRLLTYNDHAHLG
jgi:broad specificity phosphatase PhoE